MSSPPESKDELQPLRRSTRKSVAAKTEEIVLTPRKRKSTATPLKNISEKTEVVGTPRKTRAAATPRKLLAENLSTPKKKSIVLSEETPKKKRGASSPQNSNVADNSPISKRTPRKSRAREDLKKTTDAQESEEKSSKVTDEELNTNRRGRRKSVVTNPERKRNIETTIEENIHESEITPPTEESTLKKKDVEGDMPISISSRKKLRKSVHFKSDVDEHLIESDDSPPSNLDSKVTNEIHVTTVEERTCKSSLALVPKIVLPQIKQDIREGNPAEMSIEGNTTVNMPNTLAEAVCIADVPESIENYSAMESNLDKSLLSPKNFLNSDEEESDICTLANVTNSSDLIATRNEMDRIKNKLTENIAKTENEENFISPRRKLLYENKQDIDNEDDKIQAQKVLSQIESPTDVSTISHEKSEVLPSLQKESNLSEITKENVSIPEVTVGSIKDENNTLPSKKGFEYILPNKACEIEAHNESLENGEQMDIISNSDNDINIEKKGITDVKENLCDSSVSPIKDCLKVGNSSDDLMVTDSHKSNSASPLKIVSSSSGAEQENQEKLSGSPDHYSAVESIENTKNKGNEVIPTSQNYESNNIIGKDIQTTVITELEVDFDKSAFDKNLQDHEQEKINRVSHRSDSINDKSDIEETESEILPKDKTECNITRSSSESNIEIVSSNKVNYFDNKSKIEEAIPSDLNKTPEKTASLQSQTESENDDKIEVVITDVTDKSAVKISEVSTTEPGCPDADHNYFKSNNHELEKPDPSKVNSETERKNECSIERTVPECNGINTEIKGKVEEELKLNGQLDFSILDKKDLKSGCPMETDFVQSHSNYPEPSSDNKSDINEKVEIEIECLNQSKVAIKVSYFEKLEQSFDNKRTSFKKKDKCDRKNDSLSSFDESIESEKPISFDDKHNEIVIPNIDQQEHELKKSVSDDLEHNAEGEETLIPRNDEKNELDTKQNFDGENTTADLEYREDEKNELCDQSTIEVVDENKSFLDKSAKSIVEPNEEKKDENELQSHGDCIGSNKSDHDTGADITIADVGGKNEPSDENQITSNDTIISDYTEQGMDESLVGNNTYNRNNISAQNESIVEQTINEISVLEGRNEQHGLNDQNEQSIVALSIPVNKIEAQNQCVNTDMNTNTSENTEETLDEIEEENFDQNQSSITEGQKSMSENSVQSIDEISKAKETDNQKETHSGNLSINNAISVKLEQSSDEITRPEEIVEKRELCDQHNSPEDGAESVSDKSNRSIEEKEEESELDQNLSDNTPEKKPISNTDLEHSVNKIIPSVENNEYNDEIQSGVDQNKLISDDLGQNLHEGKKQKIEISSPIEDDSQSQNFQVEDDFRNTNIKLEENFNLNNKNNIESAKSISVEMECIHGNEKETLGKRNGQIKTIVNKAILSGDSESPCDHGAIEHKDEENKAVNDSFVVDLKDNPVDEIYTPEEKNEETKLHSPKVPLDDIKGTESDSREASPGIISSANENDKNSVASKKEHHIITKTFVQISEPISALDLKKEDGSKKQNSENMSISVNDFIDLEAEEVAKEKLPTLKSLSQVDSPSDTSANSVLDFLDCEAKEDMKVCHINTVENLFNSSDETDDDEDDCDWLPPPSKKANKEKTKSIQSRLIKQKVTSKNNQENFKLRRKQKINLLPENTTISTENTTIVSNKQGFFSVSTDKVAEEKKYKEKSVLVTKQNLFSVTNICEASSNKTQNESIQSNSFAVTGIKIDDVSVVQTSSKSSDSSSTTADEKCYATAVLPSRLTKKQIQNAFKKVGINDIVSIEYTATNAVLLEFSKSKSLKRALKFYGQIMHENEPIFLLAGKAH